MSGIKRNANGTEVYQLDLAPGSGVGRNASGAEVYLTNYPTGLSGLIYRTPAGQEAYYFGIGTAGPVVQGILDFTQTAMSGNYAIIGGEI